MYSPPRAPRAPERWDTSRFSREQDQRRGAPVVEIDRYEEIDRYTRSPPARRRDRSADSVYYSSRGPALRYEEKERFVERRSRRGSRYYDEDGEDMDRVEERGQMVPFESRRESVRERFEPPARAHRPIPPIRPGMMRRQSSLDTFDRKPMPRFVERETVTIPLGRRRRSPPRFVERDVEEIRIAEPDYYGDEEFRGYREREYSSVKKRGGEVVEEREEIIQSEFPKRGKTRMPIRLVNRRAVIELGYPFEEEGETLIILKALGKEHIDEVIKISREYNKSGESRAAPMEEKIIERRTEIIRDVPGSVRDWDGHSAKAEKRRSTSRKASPSHRSSSSGSTRREIFIDDERGESATIVNGVGALVISDRKRDSRSIKAEIKALEAEKKALKYETEARKEQRRAERYRESGDVVIERIETRGDVVKIEKDRKGRMSLSTPHKGS